MVRKPNKRILKTLAENIERAMEKEDCNQAIEICEKFLGIIRNYKKSKILTKQQERI